jgi:hypothetical protein
MRLGRGVLDSAIRSANDEGFRRCVRTQPQGLEGVGKAFVLPRMEGHGFSRAARSKMIWALAPEVRFFQPSAVTQLTPQKVVPQRLKPIHAASVSGTAEAVPFRSRIFGGSCCERKKASLDSAMPTKRSPTLFSPCGSRFPARKVN